MRVDDRRVQHAIQRARANESSTTLHIRTIYAIDQPPLTVIDVRCIIECLRANPRFDTLEIANFFIRDDAVMNAFRDGLLSCPSITTVNFDGNQLGNEELNRLRPAFYNTFVTSLGISSNKIQGQQGLTTRGFFAYNNNTQGQRGEFIRALLVGNNTLVEFSFKFYYLNPEGASGLEKGLAGNDRLQKLDLNGCHIGNMGLANLLPDDGMNNNSLTDLNLSQNDITGAEGGRLVGLLVQRFRKLQVLVMVDSPIFGPLGARALAPSLTLPNVGLNKLDLSGCALENDGVANLIPDGQVNRSLTNLNIRYNGIEGAEGGENAIALAARCTNLDRLVAGAFTLSSRGQQRRLNLLLDRKRLYTEAQVLGGAPPLVIFEKLVQANAHEHGLSASFVILRDYIFAEQHKASLGKQKVQATREKCKQAMNDTPL